MILIETINNKKIYSLGTKASIENTLYIDKSKYDLDWDFVDIVPCSVKRRFFVGRKMIKTIYSNSLINKRHILQISDIGTDEEWLV